MIAHVLNGAAQHFLWARCSEILLLIEMHHPLAFNLFGRGNIEAQGERGRTLLVN